MKRLTPFPYLALFGTMLLTGCGVVTNNAPVSTDVGSIEGRVYGGQQPLVGAHVYLFAAGTQANAGPGIAASSSNASKSLLTSGDGTDSIGTYVLTGTNGAFTLTGKYTCTSGTQVYAYALGGNPGSGTNSSAGLLAALGQCPSTGSLATQVPYVWMDEVTTIATAYALAGYATDATHISSDAGLTGNTSAAEATAGIANAFGNFSQLANIATGSALAQNPAGTATVPQSTINTLADILAACVNASNTTPANCTTLFSNAENSGTKPTDTATAAINIAHNPTANIANLFGLVAASGSPFQPTVSKAPVDFTIALFYTGGGLGQSTYTDVAIDSAGNAFVISSATDSANIISPSGSFSLGTSGTILGFAPYSMSLDTNNNAWLVGASGSFYSLSDSGTLSSYAVPGTSYSTGAVVVDGQNNVWAASNQSGTVYKFNSSGVLQAPTGGYYTGAGPLGYAADASNRIWTSLFYYGQTDLISTSDTLTASYTGHGQNTSTNTGLSRPAIDSQGNYWVPSQSGKLVEISSTGTFVSGSTGYPLTPTNLTSLAIDGNNNVWVVNNDGPAGIVEVNSSGTVLSAANGYLATTLNDGANSVAVDGSGDVWMPLIGDVAGVYEIIGVATPVLTPLSLAVKLNKIATRP